MPFPNILIDTNICIDAMLNRESFNLTALKILEFSEEGTINGLVSAHTFDTLFYILIQNNSRKNVYAAIEGLRRTVDIIPVTRNIIDEALALRWPDFEDAIHYRAAIAAGCDIIVTRDSTGFKDADLRVLSPLQLLDEIESGR